MTRQEAKRITLESRLMRRIVAHDIARERHAERDRRCHAEEVLDQLDTCVVNLRETEIGHERGICTENEVAEFRQTAYDLGNRFATLCAPGWKFRPPPRIYPQFLEEFIPDETVEACLDDEAKEDRRRVLCWHLRERISSLTGDLLVREWECEGSWMDLLNARLDFEECDDVEHWEQVKSAKRAYRTALRETTSRLDDCLNALAKAEKRLTDELAKGFRFPRPPGWCIGWTGCDCGTGNACPEARLRRARYAEYERTLEGIVS